MSKKEQVMRLEITQKEAIILHALTQDRLVEVRQHVGSREEASEEESEMLDTLQDLRGRIRSLACS